jgi:hypothetical protein
MSNRETKRCSLRRAHVAPNHATAKEVGAVHEPIEQVSEKLYVQVAILSSLANA